MISPSIRDEFPILQQTEDKRPIYLDNACMSLRPRAVMGAMNRYYEEMSACAGRSNHRLAAAVTEAVDDTRESVRKFLGAKRKEEIVFTRNTSEGLNLVAHSLALEPGDVVLTSDKEHNSNLVPWLKLVKQKGIEHHVVESKPDNTFDMDAYEKALSDRVKLVSMVQTSNLDGVTFPLTAIVKKAHVRGALVMIDGAQSVPHLPIDVQALGVDFLTFSGHKMCGPSGMGVLYGKYDLLERLDGFMVGGDTVEGTTYTSYELLPPPEKFEAGLQDYAGIIGLGAAIQFIEDVGRKEIYAHEQALNGQLTEALAGEERIRLIGPADPNLRGGIYSFFVEGVDAHQIALMLDESARVMVRSGQHCVHSWFANHDLPGSARASLYFYNTSEEVEVFANQLKTVLTVLG